MSDYSFDISVIVLTFNPKFEKLEKTLITILKQERVRMQVIIADDGSNNNFFTNIRELMERYDFRDYHLIGSEKNQGTCKNYLSALKAATGKYTKSISPGDYLYSPETLISWFEYMEKNSIDASFGDAVFYRNSEKENGIILFRKKTHPFFRKLFSLKHKDKMLFLKKIDYLVLQDYALGAAFFAKTDLQMRYCELLIDHIIYGEDSIYSLMLCDDVEFFYYPKEVVIYEYGLGISTANNAEWNRKLKKDNKALYEIILESSNYDPFIKRLRKMISADCDWGHNRMLKARLYPMAAIMFFIKNLFLLLGIGKSKTNIDEAFLREIGIQIA